MLAWVLLLTTVFPAVAAFGGHQRSSPSPPMAPARAPAAAAVSCTSTDIEDLPAGLVEGYKRHQAATYHAFTAEEVLAVRGGLLSWYDENRRMLPWRGDPPPWTRTASSATAAGAAATAAGRKAAKAAKADTSQPALTAFFATKPTPGAAGNADSSGSGNSSNRSSSSSSGRKRNLEKTEAGGAGGRRRAEGKSANGDEVEGAQEEQGQDALRLKRIPPSAYGTWVSEVMLQQTRVETVVDYYVKWMSLFPTPEALAEADLEQVNTAWAGLGYYRRAKMLHEGAKKVMSDHGGSLPTTAKELKGLPGIGPYTAGAVASIAFGECEPLVDGNVIRVLSRLKAIAADPKNAGLNKLCWDLAGVIVDPQRPGDFNQSLMELGATVCTVKSPSCGACPVRGSCLAHKLTVAGAKVAKRPKSEATGTPFTTGSGGVEAEGARKGGTALPAPCSSPARRAPIAGLENSCGCDVCEPGEDGLAVLPAAVTDFPRKATKTLVKEQALSVSVVERAGPGGRGPQVLLVKRPDTGLLAGQWECPCVVVRDGSESTAAPPAVGSGTKAGMVPSSEVPEKERLRAADTLLFSELGLSEALVRSRASCGSATHVFSHLRHTMQVERVTLAADPIAVDTSGTRSSREVRWVDVSDMGGLGITTGMKKVLALASKARSSSSSKNNSGGVRRSIAKKDNKGAPEKGIKRKLKADMKEEIAETKETQGARGKEKAGDGGGSKKKPKGSTPRPQRAAVGE